MSIEEQNELLKNKQNAESLSKELVTFQNSFATSLIGEEGKRLRDNLNKPIKMSYISKLSFKIKIFLKILFNTL